MYFGSGHKCIENWILLVPWMAVKVIFSCHEDGTKNSKFSAFALWYDRRISQYKYFYQDGVILGSIIIENAFKFCGCNINYGCMFQSHDIRTKERKRDLEKMILFPTRCRDSERFSIMFMKSYSMESMQRILQTFHENYFQKGPEISFSHCNSTESTFWVE